MHLPDIDTNLRDTAVDRLPMFAGDGNMAYAVMIKRLYSYQPVGVVGLQPEGAEIRHTIVCWPEDETGQSVMFPSDVCLRKPGTDVLVVGSAVAETAVREIDVAIEVGPIRKQLRVFGPRVWYDGAFGVTLSPPEPFVRCELRWEHAYGGTDMSDDGKLAREPRNPLGTGVAVTKKTLLHKPGPRIEDPNDLIQSHRSRPKPAGVAPIGVTFEPRVQYAGTIDDAWMTERMPLPPVDFDDRHNQWAAPDMIAPGYFVGGEAVRLLNVGLAGLTQFDLPREVFGVIAMIDDAPQPLDPVLDTVLIRADDQLLELTWRAAVISPLPLRRLSSIQVFEKERIS